MTSKRFLRFFSFRSQSQLCLKNPNASNSGPIRPIVSLSTTQPICTMHNSSSSSHFASISSTEMKLHQQLELNISRATFHSSYAPVSTRSANISLALTSQWHVDQLRRIQCTVPKVRTLLLTDRSLKVAVQTSMGLVPSPFKEVCVPCPLSHPTKGFELPNLF